MSKFLLVGLIFTLFQTQILAQEQPQISGDLNLNSSKYVYDSLINTITSPYLHELTSAESWLTLQGRYQGFEAIVRYDLFHNSPLLNPNEVYSKQGIGFYSVSKKMDHWDFTVGSFYDQFGSGIIYRSYEERLLGLDYATQGVRVRFSPNDSFFIKGFTGVEKFRSEIHPQIMKGINSEKLWHLGKLGMMTGAGFINRTLDQATITQLASLINAMPLKERFTPLYNVYVYSLYQNIQWKGLSLYGEYANRSREATYTETRDTDILLLRDTGGYVGYATLSYSIPKLGVSLQYKKSNSFILKTSPFDQFLNGNIGFLPALSKQHAFRLPARYGVSAKPMGETGYQGEITYSLNEKNQLTVNASRIFYFTGDLIFRENFFEYYGKFSKKLKTVSGIQTILYDQKIYENKPVTEPVRTVTPFTEWTIRFAKKKSLRLEAQYLMTKQDKGDFVFALAEFNVAPHYSFSASDMLNTKPLDGGEKVHYYSFFTSYTKEQTRLTLSYVKQVEGIVCTGGVCRLEPAFNGFKFTLSTNF